MKHKIMAFAGCLLFLLMPLNLFAKETDKTVFVAGNPDLYPIEYYDSAEEEYLGLMPDLYRLISEKTGYEFVYINKGTTNGMERMAKNDQAEIISAHLEGSISSQYIKNPLLISEIELDDQEKKVCIAFSEIASDEMISEISQTLKDITAEKKLALMASHTVENDNGSHYLLWIYILCAVALLFFSILCFLIWKSFSSEKNKKKNTMIDTRYGIGNDQYYIHCFDHLITDKSRVLYYVAYISFDNEKFISKYGEVEDSNIHNHVAEFLSNKTGAVEYLALIKDGVFAFLYQSANREEAKTRILTIMKELNMYLSEINNDYAKLFRAGVCILEENNGCTSEAAFYNAKQGYIHAVEEKELVVFGSKFMVENARRNERLRKEASQAIKKGEFVIYLQYIVDTKGTIVGAEAVSRWQHPQEGLLMPGKYINMLSQSDIIIKHDYYIFSLACKQLEYWKKQGKTDLFLSCNFTRYSLVSPDFMEHIKEIAKDYDFDHSRLIVEVTEDTLSYNVKTLRKNIEECKNFGFTIALDDIGSGYSSLTDLYNYPVDIVKVEREIVLNATEDHGRRFLNGLVRLFHSMHIKVLCEGVETEAHNEIVLSAGCDYIQGFFYSKCYPLREAERYLAEKN